MSDENKAIGRIALKRKVVSQEEFDRAKVANSPADGSAPPATRPISSANSATSEALRALSEQHGVPAIDLDHAVIDAETLAFVPREVALLSRILPLLASDDRLLLAMADPSQRRVIDEIEFVTGRRVFPYVALSHQLEHTIAAAYDAKDAGEAHYTAPHASADDVARMRAALPGGAAATAQRVSQSGEPPAKVQGSAVSTSTSQFGFTATTSVATRSIAPPSDPDLEALSNEISQLSQLTSEQRVEVGIDRALASSNGRSVLVVDDDDDIRKLVSTVLRREGYQVLEAPTGLVALQVLRETTPSLILLDAMLPGVHGFDIAQRLHGGAKYKFVPIMMMSAVHRGWSIIEDLKANYGIADYIEKPFRVVELTAKVNRLVAHDGNSRGRPIDLETIDDRAAKCLASGIDAYHEGSIDKAIALFKQGITLDPLAYRMHYYLALVYGKAGRLFDGIHELEQAIGLNPKHFPAVKNLAVLYERAGFRNRSVELWERCVSLAPDAETRDSVRAHLAGLRRP